MENSKAIKIPHPMKRVVVRKRGKIYELLNPYVMTALTLILVIALSYFTERKKAFWRTLVSWILSAATPGSFRNSAA